MQIENHDPSAASIKTTLLTHQRSLKFRSSLEHSILHIIWQPFARTGTILTKDMTVKTINMTIGPVICSVLTVFVDLVL